MNYENAAFMALMGQDYIKGSIADFYEHPNEARFPWLCDALMEWGLESYMLDPRTVLVYPHGSPLRRPVCAVLHSGYGNKEQGTGTLAHYVGAKYHVEFFERGKYAVAATRESDGVRAVDEGALP